jgi:hypothetical protein
MKKLLSREERLHPNLYDHTHRALIPVMHNDFTEIASIAKSHKIPES